MEEFFGALQEYLFPAVTAAEVDALLRERRFVVLQGPPGTGKTRMADEVRREFFGSHGRTIQFHPAVTYEDFVVGLSPDPSDAGLRFRAKPGWLLEAAAHAHDAPYLLIVDEINRGDLGKVLGEAIYLFEPGEVGGSQAREVQLTHAVNGKSTFKLPPNLYVLGTMNTADRSTETGANVMLLAPFDNVVFERTWKDGGLTLVAPSQVAVDLLTSPGRAPSEAEAILEQLAGNAT